MSGLNGKGVKEQEGMKIEYYQKGKEQAHIFVKEEGTKLYKEKVQEYMMEQKEKASIR